MRLISLVLVGLWAGVVVTRADAQAPAAGVAGDRTAAARPDTLSQTSSEPPGFPIQYTRSVSFSTNEGTWMSVDISPDGKTIVFDLLGDLYTLPIGGGRATRITEGPAFDAQPRFSPDGESLVFVSDRGGADALWLADADGRNARVLRQGAHLSPAWSPDGQCIAATMRGTPAGSDAPESADVMLYCRKGGTGLKLGTGSGAAFSPDGRYVYFMDRYPEDGRFAGAGRDYLTVYDRVEGRTYRHPGGPRPAISPDGRSLVFGTSYDARSAFKVQDLATGAERWLTLGIAAFNVTDPSRDVLPGYAFTPNGKALITWIDRKLWRFDLASGRRTLVPFTAEVQQSLGELVRVEDARTDAGAARAWRIRSARVSPDGRRLVFVALGKLWIQDLSGETPRRLTEGTTDEYAPTWSPDGRYVAYAGWSPDGGDIYRIAPDVPGAKPERLSRQQAHFDRLAYTLDGTRLLAIRGTAADRLDLVTPGRAGRIELVWLPASGGEHSVIVPLELPTSSTFVGQPFTTRDTGRVYITDFKDGLVSMRWDGSDRRRVVQAVAQNATHTGTDTADDMVLSPDGRYLAVVGGSTIAVLPAPVRGDTMIPISVAAPTHPLGPTRTLPRHHADEIAWTADARTLYYAGGSALYRYDVGRADSQPEPRRQDIAVPVSRDVARGTVVLRGARLITMNGDEVIDRGDVVVTNGRLAAVGANLPIPAGAHVVDVTGKTILPGYIDLWATFAPLSSAPATQPWEYLAYLAYGVTTIRVPGVVTPDALDYAERVEAGEMLGPRYVTAAAVVAADAAVATSEDATELVRSDGAVDWTLPLTMVQDGFPLYQRKFPLAPLGDDVVQLVARSGITYVPAVLANDGGAPPLDRRFETERVHDDPKLARFVPHPLLDQFTFRRKYWVRDERYSFPAYAADAARIVAAGGRVALGTRGALPGLGAHWELWTLHAGGMAAHDVLRAGTIVGAEALGVAGELGSLEPGKLADLQVVDGDPLEDLRRTTALVYVMKGGRLYDAATLAEVWPRRRELPLPRWLERDPVIPMTSPSPVLPPLSEQ